MSDLHDINERLLALWHPLLDLKANVTVEIGKTRIRLAEVLELKPNDIVKLARPSGESVDVFVAGELLGRGEIVPIEDRAGLRISEIFGAAV